jgi:hypothetical protein
MTKHSCDRCGREVSEYNGLYYLKVYQIATKEDIAYNKTQLCRSCVNQILVISDTPREEG